MTDEEGQGHGEDALSRLRARIRGALTSIEEREDLTDDEKASQVIHIFSASCAGLAVQPIPFADVFLLTPMQMYMAERLAAVRGVPLSRNSLRDVVADLAKVVGLGLLAQQAALGAYKVGLPYLAGFTTIPLVYGLTYAIGKTLDYLVIERARNRRVDPDEIRAYWKAAKAEGKARAKERDLKQTDSP